MKTLLIFLACILFFSCTKKSATQYQHSGTVAGMDPGACVCCGGYILTINGSDSAYRFFYFPAGSHIDSTHFPILINFNYAETFRCGTLTNFVTLQAVEKAN